MNIKKKTKESEQKVDDKKCTSVIIGGAKYG
jgi:hypothetical protein